jgi:hypothetical protein
MINELRAKIAAASDVPIDMARVEIGWIESGVGSVKRHESSLGHG